MSICAFMSLPPIGAAWRYYVFGLSVRACVPTKFVSTMFHKSLGEILPNLQLWRILGQRITHAYKLYPCFQSDNIFESVFCSRVDVWSGADQ